MGVEAAFCPAPGALWLVQALRPPRALPAPGWPGLAWLFWGLGAHLEAGAALHLLLPGLGLARYKRLQEPRSGLSTAAEDTAFLRKAGTRGWITRALWVWFLLSGIVEGPWGALLPLHQKRVCRESAKTRSYFTIT